MERETRLSLFEAELSRLLSSGAERDYALFSDVRSSDRYVLFMWVAGSLRAWVGSSSGADATALGCLGFASVAGVYERARLPLDARRLACLTELLFGAAYGGVSGLVVLAASRPSFEGAYQPLIEADA